MLLNYNKPVQVSSTLGGYQANNAVNEDIKTYWSAKTGAKGEWLISDLGEKSTINSIQINFADQDVELMGKPEKTSGHKYVLYYSDNNKYWKVAVDKSKNDKDVPHDYIEIENFKSYYGKNILGPFHQVSKSCESHHSLILYCFSFDLNMSISNLHFETTFQNE